MVSPLQPPAIRNTRYNVHLVPHARYKVHPWTLTARVPPIGLSPRNYGNIYTTFTNTLMLAILSKCDTQSHKNAAWIGTMYIISHTVCALECDTQSSLRSNTVSHHKLNSSTSNLQQLGQCIVYVLNQVRAIAPSTMLCTISNQESSTSNALALCHISHVKLEYELIAPAVCHAYMKI